MTTHRMAVVLGLTVLLMSGGCSAVRLLDRLSHALAEVEGAAGRALMQVTDSFGTQGGNPMNNPVQIYSHAREAEAWSHARAIGIYVNQGAMVVAAGDTYPAARSQAMTENSQDRRGRIARSGGGAAPANPITLFGPTAIATTEQGFRAMSAVNGMPMREILPAYGGASYRPSFGSTTVRWQPVAPRVGTGAGKERLVYTDSLGYTERGPLSYGISEVGGGPTAVAAADQAVAMSNADTPENDRYGFGNRRHMLLRRRA